MVEIFGGLLSLDRDLKLIPDLAEALPEFTQNDDGTVTYTFNLRRDALFHNGRRVMADDVKWSIERHASPDTFSPTAPDFLNDIVGAVDYMRGRADEISGIEVIDDNTIQITIDQSKPYFLFKLTYPTAFVVDRQQVENDPRNWASRPNGTGPFQLVEWNLGEGLVLERWDRYHLEPAIVERVNVRFRRRRTDAVREQRGGHRRHRHQRHRAGARSELGPERGVRHAQRAVGVLHRLQHAATAL